ncbi:hypothetical protein [Thalassospira profundimaris]
MAVCRHPESVVPDYKTSNLRHPDRQ